LWPLYSVLAVHGTLLDDNSLAYLNFFMIFSICRKHGEEFGRFHLGISPSRTTLENLNTILMQFLSMGNQPAS
jgi:hypothetical protein